MGILGWGSLVIGRARPDGTGRALRHCRPLRLRHARGPAGLRRSGSVSAWRVIAQGSSSSLKNLYSPVTLPFTHFTCTIASLAWDSMRSCPKYPLSVSA